MELKTSRDLLHYGLCSTCLI